MSPLLRNCIARAFLVARCCLLAAFRLHTHYIAKVRAKDQIAKDISELRAEAAGARRFAATFDRGPAVIDLLSYASALDNEAAQLEKACPERLPSISAGR